MKLHAFEYGKDPRFRAYTRDKGRKHLQSTITLRSRGIEIQPSQWRYIGVVSTTGFPTEQTRSLHSWVRQRGFALTQVPPIRTDFHVFDLQLDTADLRIYSSDRELVEFNRFRNRLELSPKGEHYLGADPVYKGALEIPSEGAAKSLTLSYENLQEFGFDIAVMGTTTMEEGLRRRLNRELPVFARTELKRIGVELIDLHIHSVTRNPHGSEASAPKVCEPSAAIPQTPINIQITNSNVNNPPELPAEPPQPRLFDGWVAKLLGVLAAIASIVALFKS